MTHPVSGRDLTASGLPTGATESSRARGRGCMLGGAVGDALGAPVEFFTLEEIRSRFGADGVTSFASAYGRTGAITDDTQMTLFTAEGLLRGWIRTWQTADARYTEAVSSAYLRWLRTQGLQGQAVGAGDAGDGWLYGQSALHSRRAPGNTCLSALRGMTSLGEPAVNDSKGCGGVMRVAPVGLFGSTLRDTWSGREVFALGTELAALTHGHPTGSLTGGVLSVLVMELADGAGLGEAASVAKTYLGEWPDHRETLAAIERAEALAGSGLGHDAAIRLLGEGWVAEEALAISLYCALIAPTFREGVILAVNHDGDSDSTGAITGNLLGVLYGVDAIPADWLEGLELRDVITTVADDLCDFRGWEFGPDAPVDTEARAILERYPLL